VRAWACRRDRDELERAQLEGERQALRLERERVALQEQELRASLERLRDHDGDSAGGGGGGAGDGWVLQDRVRVDDAATLEIAIPAHAPSSPASSASSLSSVPDSYGWQPEPARGEEEGGVVGVGWEEDGFEQLGVGSALAAGVAQEHRGGRWRESFDRYDLDGDGLLSVSELRQVSESPAGDFAAASLLPRASRCRGLASRSCCKHSLWILRCAVPRRCWRPTSPRCQPAPPLQRRCCRPSEARPRRMVSTPPASLHSGTTWLPSTQCTV
jgi:hypothetical protein